MLSIEMVIFSVTCCTTIIKKTELQQETFALLSGALTTSIHWQPLHSVVHL